jgi:WASH complex subunit 7
VLKPTNQIPITKIVSVFCYLQIESINLKHEIESKYFDPLIYFGENGSLFEDERPLDQTAGEREIEMSRSLPVFGEFFDTIRKISALTKNILLQMNGLFDDKYPVFKDSFKKICYSEIFDNLGSTLTNLYIVDLIIKDNAQFQDYWKQYNMMFAKVKSNPDSYTITPKMFKRLTRFCSKVYANILSGNLFDEYLNGLKESIRIDMQDKLFKNKTFAEKYLEYIK